VDTQDGKTLFVRVQQMELTQSKLVFRFLIR
jgi:hypothetical protein